MMAGIDNVYFNIKSERHSFYQALLSLGDRRVAPVIEADSLPLQKSLVATEKGIAFERVDIDDDAAVARRASACNPATIAAWRRDPPAQQPRMGTSHGRVGVM